MYAYIDSFRKFGKTNTDNQSIKIKRPYPVGDGFFLFFVPPVSICHSAPPSLRAAAPPLACGCAGMKMEGADILSDVGSFRMNGAR